MEQRRSHPTEQQHEKDATVQHHHVVEDMVAGFGAGFVAVAIGFPLDVIKTRLQTSHQTSQKEGKSMLKTGRNIVRYEGVAGLYKGMASPLLTLSVTSSISFTAYGTFRELYKAGNGWDMRNLFAGMSCGPIISTISSVENHIRTQMQIDNIHKDRFKNSWHCLSHIVRNHGIATLYTGWGVTTLKDSAYYATYFYTYEGVKETLLEQRKEDSHSLSPLCRPAAAIPIAGGVAGTSAWLVSYPLDCVRAALQGQSLKRGPKSSGWQVFQHLLQSRGIRGLFMGVTPTLVRASLVHSVRFSAYESFLWLFRNFGKETEQDEKRRPARASSLLNIFTTERHS